MSKLKRAANIAASLLMVAGSIAIFVDPEDGLLYVAVGLGAWLLTIGVQKLWYYFTMARHMVGGLSILFIGIIALDVGGLAIMLINDSRFAVALFLIGYNAFTAIIGIVRVVESKMIDSRWKASLLHSIVNLVFAIACIAFIGSDDIIVAVFCIELIYSACVQFAFAVKPTEIIYIQ